MQYINNIYQKIISINQNVIINEKYEINHKC